MPINLILMSNLRTLDTYSSSDECSENEKLCFRSKKDAIDLANSYHKLLNNIYKNTMLIHRLFQIYKLENLVKTTDDSPEQLAEKLQKKTTILSDLSMKAPLSSSLYALFSVLRTYWVSGPPTDDEVVSYIYGLPYEVGGSYFMYGLNAPKFSA